MNLHLNNRKFIRSSSWQSGIDKSQIYIRMVVFALVVLLSTACQPKPLAPQPTPVAPLVSTAPTAIAGVVKNTTALPPPQVQIKTSTPTQSPTATLPPTASLTATVTETPDPYAGLSIEELAARSYGGGELTIQGTLAENSYFTRSLILYPSDDLTIYGFMNTPDQAPDKATDVRYPVIIALHGYIDPAIYQTLDYTTRYADSLARAGFLVIHPNLRGYSPSDDGDNRFRVGMAIDVLNLIAIINEQAGKPGPLEKADPQAIGIWGHSMGGGIATRVITVSPDVRAAVLYGAMSGDDKKNYERIYDYFSNGTRGLEELQTPEDVFQRVSPVNFLGRIQAAVSLHHGEKDLDVPVTWSLETCQRLKSNGVSVECFTYPDQPHTFQKEGYDLFTQRMIDFFNNQLR